MKILWFTNTPANASHYLNKNVVGGGWMASLDFALQQNNDVKLHVAFFHGKAKEPFKYGSTWYYPILSAHQKKYKINKYLSRFSTRVIYEEDIKKYIDIIEKAKPDIIHIHGTENPFGFIAKHTNIPIVISLQGILTVYEHKYFSGIGSHQINKGIPIKEKLLGKSLKTKYRLFKNMAKREAEILKHINHLIGRTEWDKRVASIMAPNAKYEQGEEMLREPFYQNKWNQNNISPLSLFSTIGPSIYKGLETIVETTSILKEHNINFRWKIAGITCSEQISKIINKKYKIDFTKLNIELIGKKNVSELINELMASSIFVHPSHIDNSPNSVCEAMMLGIPVIATFTGGTGSLLTNKKEGLLIQDGDPWSLAGAIIELKNNSQFAIELGQNARARALKRHNKEKIVNNLIISYHRIINTK